MAKIVGVFVCLAIITLDITAGILGIQAEAAQNQVLFFFFFKIFLGLVKFIVYDGFCFSGEAFKAVDI